MRSLRKTIATRVTWLLAAVGFGASIMSFILVTLEADKFLDAQLQEIAINIGLRKQDETPPLFETEDEDHLLILVWDRSGKLLRRSGPSLDMPRQARSGLANVSVNGQEWRVYQTSDAQYDIQVAQTWSARREIATHAAAGAAFPLLLAIPLAWLGVGWSLNRTLRGLRSMSADIGRRSVDAREPLQKEEVPEEIVSLITAINELIRRHQEALETQRRFVADAAHEIRTPLAALQIQADNISAEELPEATRAVVDELGSGVRRASRLANQLLEMARAESTNTLARDEVDLVALITSVLQDFVSIAEAKDVELSLESDRPLTIVGDRNAASKLLSILLDNAIRYSRPGGSVEIKLGIDAPVPRIEIIDNGPGIPKQAMPFIYDRFFRAAPQEIEGTGLGLAIAKVTAERAHIRLSHRNRRDRAGAIAVIEFPTWIIRPSTAAAPASIPQVGV